MPTQPTIGDRIINDAGTCVTIVEPPEGGMLEPGTIPADRVDAFLDAGYRLVTDDDVIPLQAHELAQ